MAKEEPAKTKKDQYRDPKTGRYAAFPSQAPEPERRNDKYDEDDDKESHLSNLTNSPAPDVEDDPPVIHPVV